MRCKKLLLLIPFLLLGTSCGISKKGDDTQEIVNGIAVPSSSLSGLALATTNPDRSISSSNLYYYDFATGEAKRLLNGESGNPSVFWADQRLFHFNSQGSQRNFRTFDPKETSAPPEATDLEALTEGDPFALATLQSGTSVVMASPLAGALQTLDFTTGTLSTIAIESLPNTGLHPVDLYRSSNQLFVLNSGVDSDLNPIGGQQVFVFDVANDDLTPRDQKTNTTKLDGLAITASYPTAFVGTSTGKPYVAGLCRTDLTGCEAGADRLDPSVPKTSVVKKIAAGFGYSVVNQIIDGPSSSTVYAHVQSHDDDSYQVIKLDLITNAVETIHTFPDGVHLYGIFYDASSDTLFVGGKSEVMGSLSLYRHDTFVDSFELGGVPVKGAFVP